MDNTNHGAHWSLLDNLHPFGFIDVPLFPGQAEVPGRPSIFLGVLLRLLRRIFQRRQGTPPPLSASRLFVLSNTRAMWPV